MHLAYAYIGSGKNGNACSLGQDEKTEQDSRRNLADFEKVLVEQGARNTAQEDETRKNLPENIPLVYNKKKSRVLRKHRRVNNRQNRYKNYTKRKKKERWMLTLVYKHDIVKEKKQRKYMEQYHRHVYKQISHARKGPSAERRKL